MDLGAEGLWVWKIKPWWSKVTALSFIAVWIQECCKHAGRAGEGLGGQGCSAASVPSPSPSQKGARSGGVSAPGEEELSFQQRGRCQRCQLRSVGPSRMGALPDSSICASMGKAGAPPSAPLACVVWKIPPCNPSAPQGSVFASFPMGKAHKSSVIALMSWMEEPAAWGGGYTPVVTLWSGGSQRDFLVSGQAGAFSWHWGWSAVFVSQIPQCCACESSRKTALKAGSLVLELA